MSFTLVTGSNAGAFSIASGTFLNISPGVTIPAGSLIVGLFAVNLVAAGGSVADNSTQAGAANVYTMGTLRTGTTWGWRAFRCVTTRALLSGDAITVTTASASRRSASVAAFTPSNHNVVLDTTASFINNDTTSPVGPTSSSGTLGASDALLVAFSANRNPGSAPTFGHSAPAGWTAGSEVTAAGVSTGTAAALSWRLSSGSTTAYTVTDTWTQISEGGIESWSFTDSTSGTLFTKTVTGSAQFAGIRPKVAMQRKTLGVLSFSGAEVAHPTARSVTASFAPAGSLSRQLSLLRTITAALSFSGTRTAATAYARSLVGAVFAPTGVNTRVKAVSKAVSGALSFVGAQTRFPQKTLTAAFTPVGSVTRLATLARILTAALAPVGSLKRSTNRKLLGAAQYVGMVITSQGATHLTAVFRPTGAPVTHGLPARTLFAGFQATSTLARFTTRQLVSSLIASGVMHTQYLPPAPPPFAGGGGFGALMSDAHFQRYHVASAWRGVKRVKP